MRKRLNLKGIHLWRAGSSAVKKVIKADRDGIQGGALLDKSPHDLSITVELLEPERIKGFNVKDAEIVLFIAAPEAVLKGERAFLDAVNDSTKCIQLDYQRNRKTLSADGLISASVLWHLEDREEPISSNYLFSWLGVSGAGAKTGVPVSQQWFTGYLRRLRFPPDQWLAIDSDKGPKRWINPPEFKEVAHDATHLCTVQEVRVGIIECDQSTIVCNMLPKYNQVRWAFEVKPDGTRDEIYSENQVKETEVPADRYKKLKGDDLGKIFYVASLAALGKNDKAKYIRRDAAILVHSVLFEIQEHAINKITNAWLEDCRCAIDGRVAVWLQK